MSEPVPAVRPEDNERLLRDLVTQVHAMNQTLFPPNVEGRTSGKDIVEWVTYPSTCQAENTGTNST